MRISGFKTVYIQTYFYEIHSAARAVQDVYDIIIVLSTHVETVVSLSHKNADSHIHVNIEFGEGDGKIPVDKIAQKAELI